jgi:flavin reductase (DIM6/NTAB) family NADH-FMN oxidoreductase RutF
VAVSVEQGSLTNELLATTGLMALSVLRREDRAVVRRFVKPVSDLELDARGHPRHAGGEAIHLAPNGAPVLDDALGWLALRTTATQNFTSHRVYFAEVTDAGAANDLLTASPSDKSLAVLRMEDTRMNYGG